MIPFAGQLFEKWNEDLDRESQHTLWNSLAEECRMDGISFENGIALKNRVRNWVNRAEVRIKIRSFYIPLLKFGT